MRGKVKLTHGQAQHSPPHPQDFHLVFHTDVDKPGLPAGQSGVAWCEWKRLDASTDLPAHSSGSSRLPMPRPSSARARRRMSTGSRGTRSGARYDTGHGEGLVRLFERIRGDQLRRRFLGAKVLESLYVLGEECGLPLFEELLVAGHTDPDVDRCEVTRALVMVRRATGRVAQS